MKKFFCALMILFATNFSAANAADIAAYEAALDVYNFDGPKINWENFAATARKLEAIDPTNATAFRAKIYLLRHEGKPHDAIDLCQAVLKAKKNPPELLIEACLQLGEIYFNVFDDTKSARKFVNRGIALVKKNYSSAQIETLVNGTNVQLKDLELVGRSNSIRELYILKSELENYEPQFDKYSKMINLELLEDNIFNIKYRVDW